MLNPFGTTFESLDGPIGPVVESVHQAAYERLLELIESEDGNLISLRAPRAGYGKTMLLSRLRERKKGKAMLVPVHLADGQRIEGESILEELLTQLTESVPGMAGLTRLDFYTRRLFAHGLLPLVYSGEIPCQDKDGAVASLRERPTEAFDFHSKEAAIAQWSKEQFNILAPRLTSVLSKSSGSSSRDTSYWIELIFNFAIRSSQETSRIGFLMETVFGRNSRFRTGAGFLDGLGSFLNLVTLVEPVVLVLDEVDGLSSDTDAALRATSCLISLWESCRRVSVVVSANDDVWNSAFAPRLPAGLRDRLEDVVIRLHSLTLDEASALISARAGAEASKVISKLDLSLGDLFPRGILRAARDVWNHRDEPGHVQISSPALVAREDDPSLTEFDPSPVSVHTELVPPPRPEPKIELQSPIEPESAFARAPGFIPQFVPSVSDPLPSPFESFPPPVPLVTYPPHPVMRAAMPRAFEVQRIREAPPVADFNKPFSPSPPVQSPFPPNPFQMDVPLNSAVEERLTSPAQGTPFDSAPVGKSRESQRLYPSNSPFDLSIAVEAMNPDPVRANDPFPQGAQFSGSQTYQENPYSGDSVQKSPFEIVSPAPSPRRQNPQADADAIDELLRQFREHRDS